MPKLCNAKLHHPVKTGRRCLVDKASALGSGGRRFEPHGERLSKDGCLSWELFRYGRFMSRELLKMNGYRLLSAWRLA
ncbi:hypothetical protein DPMN_191499 [Dreissena polymorpha]|uniref:Uncharacterized protein n=1 Tax=Dreissena polymorpha TaxID=45954 RepID=A0A9D4BEN9_DREPO|nr:hypothetical protein DPMN_191499 [Dreissena polymorpha]